MRLHTVCPYEQSALAALQCTSTALNRLIVDHDEVLWKALLRADLHVDPGYMPFPPPAKAARGAPHYRQAYMVECLQALNAEMESIEVRALARPGDACRDGRRRGLRG